MRRFFALLLPTLLPMQIFCFSVEASQTPNLVFTNVTVIDMTGAPPKGDMTVIIEGSHLVKIGKTTKIEIPKNAQIIDGKGKFLIPSFWDMHVHILPDQ